MIRVPKYPISTERARPAARALALAAGLALSGCATRERIVHVVVPPPPLADRIPAQLLACRQRPVPDALDRQSDVARYVVDLDAAGQDCRSKLAGINEIVEADGRKEEEHK